jgi:hypothetical protein
VVAKENGTINFPDDNNPEQWDPRIFLENVQQPHQANIL